MIGGTLYDYVMNVNLHCDNEQDIRMSSKKYETDHYLNLDH